MGVSHRRVKGLLIDGYRLTTAEILYHIPDYPSLLQSFVWQDYDFAPKFPVLARFLNFWEANLDGKLHSVKIASRKILTGDEIRYAAAQLHLH
ncbi:MAG: Usg family protein [Proteobacteria bacterium]|nr:Usg family protein [Pseudomonadota bacterium]